MTKTELGKTLDEIEKICDPTSIFLYGSRARTDAVAESDYEIGVLMPQDKYVSRAILQEAVKNSMISIYPFRLEQFLAGDLDTPFNKNIYLRELVTSGKTLRGEKIIENMHAPSIDIIDLLSDAQFNLGYALAATIAHRNNSNQTANLLFSKSCLFGTRTLIMMAMEMLPASYDEIMRNVKNLDLDLEDYTNLIKSAYRSRSNNPYDPQMLFKNISYLNQLIIPTIRKRLDRKGNKIIVQ